MEKVDMNKNEKLELQKISNLYGIKSFDTNINLSTNNLIHAPNGTMKSSFSAIMKSLQENTNAIPYFDADATESFIEFKLTENENDSEFKIILDDQLNLTPSEEIFKKYKIIVLDEKSHNEKILLLENILSDEFVIDKDDLLYETNKMFLETQKIISFLETIFTIELKTDNDVLENKENIDNFFELLWDYLFEKENENGVEKWIKSNNDGESKIRGKTSIQNAIEYMTKSQLESENIESFVKKYNDFELVAENIETWEMFEYINVSEFIFKNGSTKEKFEKEIEKIFESKLIKSEGIINLKINDLIFQSPSEISEHINKSFENWVKELECQSEICSLDDIFEVTSKIPTKSIMDKFKNATDTNEKILIASENNEFLKKIKNILGNEKTFEKKDFDFIKDDIFEISFQKQKITKLVDIVEAYKNASNDIKIKNEIEKMLSEFSGIFGKKTFFEKNEKKLRFGKTVETFSLNVNGSKLNEIEMLSSGEKNSLAIYFLNYEVEQIVKKSDLKVILIVDDFGEKFDKRYKHGFASILKKLSFDNSGKIFINLLSHSIETCIITKHIFNEITSYSFVREGDKIISIYDENKNPNDNFFEKLFCFEKESNQISVLPFLREMDNSFEIYEQSEGLDDLFHFDKKNVNSKLGEIIKIEQVKKYFTDEYLEMKYYDGILIDSKNEILNKYSGDLDLEELTLIDMLKDKITLAMYLRVYGERLYWIVKKGDSDNASICKAYLNSENNKNNFSDEFKSEDYSELFLKLCTFINPYNHASQIIMDILLDTSIFELIELVEELDVENIKTEITNTYIQKISSFQ